MHRIAKEPRIGHRVRRGLLDIGIAARIHRLGAMLRVLEVSRRDQHRVDILACV